jgi:hypothetical protein
MKWILRTLGLTGTLLFASLLFITFHTPNWVEVAARDFITSEVRAQVDAHIEGIEIAKGGDALAQAAGVLHRRNAERMAGIKTALAAKIHERVADALTQVRELDCECRDRIAEMIQAGMTNALTSLDGANARLTDFVHEKYLRVVGELKRDIRIFSATNAVACLLLLVLSFARPRAIEHLVFPGVLLAVAVTVSSYCYLFEQNWLFTLIYSDYFGFAYLGFLGFIFGLLLDIFVNRGRVTTQLGNGVLHAVGSAFSLSPC